MAKRPPLAAWARRSWSAWRPAWAAFLLLVSACVCVLYTGQEPAVRLYGLVLQVLGILAVVHDLRKTNQHFGRRGIRASIRHAWNHRPGTVQSVQMEFDAWTEMTVGSARVAPGPPAPGTPVHVRVELLERRIVEAQAELGSVRGDLAQEKRERIEALSSEGKQRQQAIEGLDRRVEEVVAGSVPVSLLGVWSLLLGVVLATASHELAGAAVWLGR